MSGLAVIDKPAGLTSHQVVNRLRRITATRRVGHAGTLDPMATGILLVGIGRATRLLGHLALSSKSYRATIRLGMATLTDDAEGEFVRTPGAGSVRAAEVAMQLAGLRGDIWQVPSSVSAIKVRGQRAYARVRAGEQVELSARPARIERLELTDCRPGMIDGVAVLDCDIDVSCSSGTYIRALARDLGNALGTGGHLIALRRTRVGPFSLSEALTLEQAEQARSLLPLRAVAYRCFATLTLDDGQAVAVRYGRPLRNCALPASTAALLDSAGELLALYRQAETETAPHADPEAVPDAVPLAVFAPAVGSRHPSGCRPA